MEPETPLRLIYYAKRCQVTKTHSSMTKKQAALKSYFKDGGTGTGFVRRSFIHCFVQWGVFWLCLFTATELSYFVASLETTANLETPTFLRWLWICCCVVFVCICCTVLGIIHILSRCWRKIAKIYVKMGTESWKLPLKQVFCLKELIIVIQKLSLIKFVNFFWRKLQ